MEGLQKDPVNRDETVTVLVVENEKQDNQLTDQNKQDMSKCMAANDLPRQEHVAVGQFMAFPEKQDECLNDKTSNEELNDNGQLQKVDVTCKEENVNFSFTEDVLTIFPFVCGICDEKFNNLTTYFMHISVHESVNTFLHCCDHSNDGVDKNSVFFSCGICDIKYPTLCTLYKHLLETEGVTDFVYRNGERTAHAYNYKTENYEIPKNINNSYRFRKRTTHALNKKASQLDCPKNIAGLDKTDSLGKQCVDDLCGNSGDESDTTIIGENTIKEEVEIGTRFTPSSKETVNSKNVKKSQKRSRKKVFDKNTSKTSEKKGIKSRRTGTERKTRVSRGVHSKPQNKIKNAEKYFKKYSVSSSEVVSNSEMIMSLIYGGANMADVDSNVAVDVRHHVSGEGDKLAENEDKNYSRETVLDKNEENAKTNQLAGNRRYQLYPCEICGALIKYQYLKRHKTTHEECTLACDQCDNLYNCKHKLRLHKKQVHTDEKKYICDECGKSFKAWPYLKQHRQIHIKERNILCPVCPMKFKYAALLRTHMKTHLDEKPYSCDECGMKFKRADLLSTHKKYHKEEKPFSCPECSKKFKIKQDMKKHYKIHLPPKFFCEICGKSFVQKYNMRIHMKTHGKFP